MTENITDYLRNPIVLGLLASVSTYLYLYWEAEQKYKKNKKIEKKSISIITPGIIGVIVWFIASSYFENSGSNSSHDKSAKTNRSSRNSTNHELFRGGATGSNKNYLINRTSTSNSNSNAQSSDSVVDSKSFYLIGKSKLKLPNTDVFIDA
jgi:hypothetical protein